MKLLELDISSIPFGQPIPFALRGVGGVLLAGKGFVIRSQEDLKNLLLRGHTLYVDTDESGDAYRAYLAQLQAMLQRDTKLGDIAETTLQAKGKQEQEEEQTLHPRWKDWQLHWTQLMRQPDPQTFAPRLGHMFAALANYSQKNPDAALLALVQLSAEEVRFYSATHGMLVAVITMLVARETLCWPHEQVQTLGRAALTMNIAMAQLQDDLAQQYSPLSAEQAKIIDHHSEMSVHKLQMLEVGDPLWLEAIKFHHYRDPGRLTEKSLGRQMARLIQRADIFGARIAPRVGREPMSVTSAMQACYYDETKAVDETGAALVKTLGIYPPGAWVYLASGEAGVVIRRSQHAATPRVAVFLNRDGMPCDPIPRNTASPTHKITGAVAHRDVRVSVPLERLLAL